MAVSAAALGAPLFSAGAALAQEPKAIIRGEMPANLREAIVTAVGESRNAPTSALEARRRANEAGTDAILVLRSEGYYAYHVVPEVNENGQAIVTIETGPRFRIAVPLITWLGEVPPEDVQAAAERAMGLREGDPGAAAAVVSARGAIVAAVRQRGYADATAQEGTPEDPTTIVDQASQTVIPEFRIEAGSLVRLDGVDLRTEGRTNPAWVRQLAPWEEGDVYDPADVAALERRLLDARVYQSVAVALAPADQSNEQGHRPVVVSLADQPRGILEVGAGWSTTEGIGLDGRYLRFNRFGRADTLTFIFRFARIQSRVDAELSLPHWRVADRTLRVGAGAYDNTTDAFDETGLNLRADITRHFAKTSYRTIGVAADVARLDERFPVVRTRDLATLTGLYALTWDGSNDPLDPTRGWKLDGRAEPTVSAGDGSSFYLRVQAQGSAYLPLGQGDRTVLAGRLKLGSVVGATLFDIPASRRFYAGGGGSVRGYQYQGVGPRFVNNTPQGGLGLFEASFEVRRDIRQRWGAVAFVDVGSVSSSEAPDFSNTSTGVGVGARYDLGFGPLRADLAIPLTRRAGDSAYQIYLSIGQSF